jgi:hypothetical protein
LSSEIRWHEEGISSNRWSLGATVKKSIRDELTVCRWEEVKIKGNYDEIKFIHRLIT